MFFELEVEPNLTFFVQNVLLFRQLDGLDMVNKIKASNGYYISGSSPTCWEKFTTLISKKKRQEAENGIFSFLFQRPVPIDAFGKSNKCSADQFLVVLSIFWRFFKN